MTFVDYSALESEISNAKDPKILEAGSEAKIRIVKVKSAVSENQESDFYGCAYHMITFDVPDDPMVNEFTHLLWELDRSNLNRKTYERSLSEFKHFAACFSIDYSRPFDWEDFVGREGWVIVGVKKDDTYGDKNTIKKYIHTQM